MATGGSQHTKPKCGIIILGNAGAGKSFICNIFIGRKHFKSEGSAEAVTTQTNTYTIQENKYDVVIYDVPGLIDDDEERLKKNKEEIEKAFEKCPDSIVMFVWSNIGGRFQPNDAIAFKALYGAYKFEQRSLFSIVNNLDPERPDNYNAIFLTKVNKGLEEVNVHVPIEDTCFLEKINPSIRKEMDAARDKLMLFFAMHTPTKPERQGDIIVPSLKELKELRKALELIEKAAELKNEENMRKIDEMNGKILERDRALEKMKMGWRNVKPNSFSFDDAIGGAFRTPSIVGAGVVGAAAVSSAVSGAVSGGINGTVDGFCSGSKAVVNSICDFAEDRNVPVAVRVVATPVLLVGATVVAPVAAVATAVIKGVEGTLKGFADGINGLFR